MLLQKQQPGADSLHSLQAGHPTVTWPLAQPRACRESEVESLND